MASEAANEAGASGFLLGDDAAEFMRQRGEQTWESANEAGGCTAEWCDECEQCGNGGGLRVCCGYCNLVFHPTCLDPPQDAQVVENWDEVTFACGSCVKDAMGKVANTTQRLKRQMRQRRATTAAAEARRAARDNEIRDEHEAIALFVEQREANVATVKGYGGTVQLSADASALMAGERLCPTPVDLRPLSPPNPRELTEKCVETFYKKVCPERLKKRDFLRNVMRHPDDVIIERCLKAYGTAPTPLKQAAGADSTF